MEWREKKGASEDEGRVEHDRTTTLTTTSKAIRENFTIVLVLVVRIKVHPKYKQGWKKQITNTHVTVIK